MRFMILIFFVGVFVLMSCSGTDKITTDTIAPIPPFLIPHLGDLGDGLTTYYGTDQQITDDNNGIDADPDGDWIRVSWQHFLDTDLDYVKIYRYDDNPNDIVHTPVLVDSISSDREYFMDSRSQLSTNLRYSYFIEVVDNSGNTALSDTVSYALLSKQILVSPGNGTTVNPGSITYEWQRSGSISKIRVLVFDEEHQYLWHRDIDVAFEDDVMTTTMPSNWVQALDYTGNHIYWRIDAFEWDNELQIFAGSESNEWLLYLNSK